MSDTCNGVQTLRGWHCRLLLSYPYEEQLPYIATLSRDELSRRGLCKLVHRLSHASWRQFTVGTVLQGLVSRPKYIILLVPAGLIRCPGLSALAKCRAF